MFLADEKTLFHERLMSIKSSSPRWEPI